MLTYRNEIASLGGALLLCLPVGHRRPSPIRDPTARCSAGRWAAPRWARSAGAIGGDAGKGAAIAACMAGRGYTVR